MVSSTPWPHFTPRKDRVPILQEAGWAPGPVWTGEKSRPHRNSVPDRPSRSQSLYRLSYPALSVGNKTLIISRCTVQLLKILSFPFFDDTTIQGKSQWTCGSTYLNFFIVFRRYRRSSETTLNVKFYLFINLFIYFEYKVYFRRVLTY